jgi:hypothetical protein
MRSLRPSLIAAILLGLAAVAVADGPIEIPRLRSYIQSTPPILRFAIADGRLALRCRTSSNFQTRGNTGNDQKETMTLRSGQGFIDYERVTADEQIKIAMEGAGKTSISRTPRGKSTFVAMEFRSAPGEKTTLTLGTGDHRQVLQAADFWRLAIVHKDECKEHLFPLLDVLRPDSKLAGMVAGVEKTLVERANASTAADDARWEALVKQLGDDRFAKREAADRALRAGGDVVLTYLRQLDFNHLDAEQQFRIRRILRAAAGRSDDDTADEVATSLSNDPGVWLAILGRPDLATRQTAAKQLAKLLDRTIDVDPNADPKSQKDKRDKLRALIEKK